MRSKIVKLVYLVGLVLAINLNASANDNLRDDQVVVTGVIENYDKDRFEFSYDAYALLRSTEKVAVDIDDKGHFKIVVSTSSPLQGVLSFGKIMIKNTGYYRYIYTYLEPGDSVHVQADLNDIKGTLAFSGSAVDNNVYVNEEDFMFNTYDQRVKNNYAFIAHKQPNAYKYAMDSIQTKKLAYLKQYKKTHNMSDKLYEAYRLIYVTDALIRKINYPSGHKGFNKGVEAQLPADYYDFLENVELAINLDDKGMPYMRFLHFYLTNTYQLSKANGYDKDYITYIKSQLTNKRDQYVYMAYSLGSDFNAAIYRQFGKNCPYTDIAQIVEKKYKRLEGMLPGSPAPEVTLTNIKGEAVSLSDFKGKYVYLDFWATWCKPCIKEIPHLLEIEKLYHDKDIIFVSISTDADKEKWEDFVDKEDMKGIQVWADADNKKIFNYTFNIRMIPRFVLIDDEGKIVDANAPRPSEEDLKTLLNKVL